MATYKVLSAEKKKEFTGQNGTFYVYSMRLEDDKGMVRFAEIVQKPETPPPSGQIEGEITEGEYGDKFRRSRQFGGGGGPRPEDPAKAAQIRRMHCQKVAVEYTKLSHARGKLPEGFTIEALKPIIDWFDEDAKAAKP